MAGYVETKRFALWFGDGTQGTGSVAYDMERRRFQIAGAAGWRLFLKGEAPGSKVEVMIGGSVRHAAADSAGVAMFSETK